MKKIKFNAKLNLNKTIVSQLNSAEQAGLIGGKMKKTETGPGVCTARPTLFCCEDKTATGPGVCTAMPTLFCCGAKSKYIKCVCR